MLSKMEYNALLPFRDGPITNLSGPTQMIKHLETQGFLEVSETDYVGDFTLVDIQWRLTPKGESSLQEAEERKAQEEQRRAEQKAAEAQRLKERHDDHAREERYHRTQNRVSVASALLGSVASFLLGLIAEHYVGIIAAIAAWFH